MRLNKYLSESRACSRREAEVHDHLVRARLELSGIRTLVLDEADRWLEMGFVETVSATVRGSMGSLLRLRP